MLLWNANIKVTIFLWFKFVINKTKQTGGYFAVVEGLPL